MNYYVNTTKCICLSHKISNDTTHDTFLYIKHCEMSNENTYTDLAIMALLYYTKLTNKSCFKYKFQLQVECCLDTTNSIIYIYTLPILYYIGNMSPSQQSKHKCFIVDFSNGENCKWKIKSSTSKRCAPHL